MTKAFTDSEDGNVCQAVRSSTRVRFFLNNEDVTNEGAKVVPLRLLFLHLLTASMHACYMLWLAVMSLIE